MYDSCFFKRSFFALFLSISACCLWHMPNQAAIYPPQTIQAATYPTQTISEKIGEELSRNILSVSYDNQEVVIVGQTHTLPSFYELKKWLLKEALAGKLVLILEGLPRNFSWEKKYRHSVGGYGEEPIYGMENEVVFLVEAGIICHHIASGIIENYGINCLEQLINLSSFDPLGEQIWNELSSQESDKETHNLICEIDPFIRQIQSAPDLQAKLNTFDVVRNNF